jgi:hypothetical protein
MPMPIAPMPMMPMVFKAGELFIIDDSIIQVGGVWPESPVPRLKLQVPFKPLKMLPLAVGTKKPAVNGNKYDAAVRKGKDHRNQSDP